VSLLGHTRDKYHQYHQELGDRNGAEIAKKGSISRVASAFYFTGMNSVHTRHDTDIYRCTNIMNAQTKQTNKTNPSTQST
jgi:hypothetical protein